MTRKLLLTALALAGITAACSPGNNFRDVEGKDSRVPDAIEVYSNVDQHPNIVKVCIDGVAFATTSREYSALTRVEAWDRTCPNAKGQ